MFECTEDPGSNVPHLLTSTDLPSDIPYHRGSSGTSHMRGRLFWSLDLKSVDDGPSFYNPEDLEDVFSLYILVKLKLTTGN